MQQMIFIADFNACSTCFGQYYAHHQELNTTGSDHLYNTLELLMMGIVLPETCWACIKICNKYHLLHLVGSLFPHNILNFWKINALRPYPLVYTLGQSNGSLIAGCTLSRCSRFAFGTLTYSRSRGLLRLSGGSVATRLLGMRVSIPGKARMSVCC